MNYRGSQNGGAKLVAQEGNSPDRRLRSLNVYSVGNDVETHKQPGCGLRSSHAFKECVTAHWSMVTLRGKYNGAKYTTEDTDFKFFKPKVVAERSLGIEARPEGLVERREVRMLE